MIFPGNNKLVLTQEALCRAIEDAINGAMQPGEDFIRVTDISRTYNWGDFEITFTTDKEKDETVTPDNPTDAG